MAFQLGAPRSADDAQSITIFTGGTFSLPWTLNSSDPQLFDLVLLGLSGNTETFPGIASKDLSLDMTFTSQPQVYFFRALDNTTGTTLAESSTFEVTASPSVISAPPQSQSLLAHTGIARGALIGAIVGAVAGTAFAAGLIWFFCVHRRRAAPREPVLIDDDCLSKSGSEMPVLPVYVKLSPFPVPPTKLAPLRLSPLRVAGQPTARTMSTSCHTSYERPASSHRKSSSTDTTNSVSTLQTSVARPPKLSYKPVSHQHNSSIASTRRQTLDLGPGSPLTEAAVSSMDHARTRKLPAKLRLEQRDELETALSETVYDKGVEPGKADPEPKTPKTPTRRAPLRLRTIGSADGHEPEDPTQQNLSAEMGGV
ncbi:hypothetical protein K438DRAFT_1862634, partial [Mycena galopus ATCC 62051]